MRNFFHITATQNQEKNLDPHESKVHFLGKPGKQESAEQAALRNLSELEEPQKAPYDQGVLTYIKKLNTYVLDIADTLLGFACDAEASALVLSEDLDNICIQTEAARGRVDIVKR